MASTITQFSDALKRIYTLKRVADLTGEDAPLLARIPKDENFEGKGEEVPLIYGRPQGLAGQSLAIAQTNSTNLSLKSFLIRNGRYQGSVSIGDEVMRASRSNMGSFLRNKVEEIDGLIRAQRDDLAHILFTTSAGWFGIVASTASPGGGALDEIVVTEPWMVQNVEVGMRFVSSAATGDDPGDTLNDAGDPELEVLGVERSTGTIFVAEGGVASITGLGSGDYLFRQGNFKGGTGTFIMHGVQDYIWVDEAPPDLNGMDRSPDPSRLAGVRLTATDVQGLSIEERLQLLGTVMVSRHKGPGPTDIYVNPEDFLKLSVSAQSKGWRQLEDKSTSFGFLYLEVAMGGKMVKVFADRYCPLGLALALKLDTWKLKSMGPLIDHIKGDGLEIVRAAATNDYEYRSISYPELVCNAPGWNGRVSLIG